MYRGSSVSSPSEGRYLVVPNVQCDDLFLYRLKTVVVGEYFSVSEFLVRPSSVSLTSLKT